MTTKRPDIITRQFRSSDAESFAEAVLESVEHLSPWLSWCTTNYSIYDARHWAGSARETWDNGTDYRFLAEDRKSQQLLGCVGINQVVSTHRVGNLGYWIRASCINRGVCSAAARQVVEFAFRELGFARLEIHTHPRNEASNAVALKLGAQFEGCFRNKIIINGESSPANCYSIIPADFGLPATSSGDYYHS